MAQLELVLAGAPSDAAMARTAIHDLLADNLAIETVQDAILLVSELVSNVAMHTTGPARLRATFRNGAVPRRGRGQLQRAAPPRERSEICRRPRSPAHR